MEEGRPWCFGPMIAMLYSALVSLTFLPGAVPQYSSRSYDAPQDKCSFDWECPQDGCCMADIRTIDHIVRHCVQNVGPLSVCGRPRHCSSKPNEGCGPYHGHQCQHFNHSPPLPYYGECTVPPNPCSSAPCLNRGTCIALDASRFFCQCPSPSFGPQCQFLPAPPNPCSSAPCLNRGTCIALDASRFFCQCPSPFFGPQCQFLSVPPNPCSSAPCLNQGNCIALDASRFFCQCSSPFFGPQCQFFSASPVSQPAPPPFQRPDIPIAEPLPIDTETGSGECDMCLNNAVCDLDSTAICKCRGGFTGQFCEIAVTKVAS